MAPLFPHVPRPQMTLAVLNPGGRDAEQLFADGAGAPDDRVHAPVNYHAYAACTGGGFYRDAARIPAECGAVLVLLRRDLKPALRALRELRAQGRAVAISWKESGQHQISRQLDDAGALGLFREICGEADGALSSTPELVSLYREAGARVAEFIPTPYPLEDGRWDFARPLAERSGIFIGTREWNVPTRNHAAALLRACALAVPVTVCNPEGRTGRKKLAALGCERLQIIEGRRPYTDYLREMAKCRVVFQLDTSAVPGQVAGDALLCRMPCVGGNSAIEQFAFDQLPPLEMLLNDDVAWQAAVVGSQAQAIERLSFAAGARRLTDFFASLAK
jgi:hypothetical protein